MIIMPMQTHLHIQQTLVARSVPYPQTCLKHDVMLLPMPAENYYTQDCEHKATCWNRLCTRDIAAGTKNAIMLLLVQDRRSAAACALVYG